MNCFASVLRTVFLVLGMSFAAFFLWKEMDAAAFKIWGIGRDATDSEARRSGLALFTDAQTGCQYVGSAWGGLTPRIGRDGHQICGAAP